MAEHLRFAVVYWHTFRGTGSDPFGAATMQRPWEDGSDSVENAIRRARVAFELIEKLGAPSMRFRPRRWRRRGRHWPNRTRIWIAVVESAAGRAAADGNQAALGNGQLVHNPRYMHGAATTCNADAFAYAAAQVKKCLEVTKELGGVNYVFWGGREGYQIYGTPTCAANSIIWHASFTWRSIMRKRSALAANS